MASEAVNCVTILSHPMNGALWAMVGHNPGRPVFFIALVRSDWDIVHRIRLRNASARDFHAAKAADARSSIALRGRLQLFT